MNLDRSETVPPADMDDVEEEGKRPFQGALLFGVTLLAVVWCAWKQFMEIPPIDPGMF